MYLTQGLWWILRHRWETHTFFYISDSCCSLTVLTATCNFSSTMQHGWKKVNRRDVVHFSGTLCLHYANGGSVPVFHPRRVLRKEFRRWYSAKEFWAVRTCEKKRPKANLWPWVNAHNRGRTSQRTPQNRLLHVTYFVMHRIRWENERGCEAESLKGPGHGEYTQKDLVCLMSSEARHVFHPLMANYGQYHIVVKQTQARWLQRKVDSSEREKAWIQLM